MLISLEWSLSVRVVMVVLAAVYGRDKKWSHFYVVGSCVT